MFFLTGNADFPQTPVGSAAWKPRVWGAFGALQIFCNPASNLQTRVCCAFLLTIAVEPWNSCTSWFVMQEEMISKTVVMLQTLQDYRLNEAFLGRVPI